MEALMLDRSATDDAKPADFLTPEDDLEYAMI
jgi:hypothetical protein